ncbi:translation elongation factor Ts [Schwartzia succinivorans]|jgi:elongation factor Ts|uniref:Elongation factor Ts n=1 Tax=Schwartzia succinivorans DSM 10502 TaxID=1123243 RepID=A0A1M4W7D3_9FIRM|nr:translation elongation factor Ts [Schwartzia succinivorans]MBQ3863462.1 elongation factor Ts [Schwartzia sp. (in: firmicutes)]MBE6096401.1 elongation factor Ts [Schwartzia succinivorans]MBQ4152623.1 elongation factor Ts [Schwartzia sp. (in: firmicutes)]MBQ5413899.1 elongation factor Ts [Schwartzia sp. (in: firmicutes)]MCR5446784.1 translation elongation factor Ts [Schwartzia sp. (in: firmicutes)]
MAQITAAMVKELREKTGAGMMDCKKALAETDGDQAKAIDYLREKGIAKAGKKADRVAAEGVVGAYVSDDAKVGSVVEVNCETDFVANTDNFHAMVDKIAKHIADTNPADVDALNDSVMDGKKVSDFITEQIATIGEKISIRRFARYETAGRVASYIHMGGKIGVLVELTGGEAQLGKDVAMQIAAANPSCVDRAGVDPAALAHEREVLKAQALEEGKPEKIVEKMVDGRINKYYKEVCLVEQSFVKDPEQTIKQVLGDVEVKGFARFMLGEGIEKKQEDFAAEVMSQIKQ